MDKELFEKGLATRRDVLGREYVDNALATASEFAQGFQELLAGESNPCHVRKWWIGSSLDLGCLPVNPLVDSGLAVCRGDCQQGKSQGESCRKLSYVAVAGHGRLP